MQVATAASDASCGRERPGLDRAAGHDRVREKGELLAPLEKAAWSRSRANCISVWMRARRGAGLLRSVEQRARRLRQDARLEQHIDDGVDRIGGVLARTAAPDAAGRRRDSAVGVRRPPSIRWRGNTRGRSGLPGGVVSCPSCSLSRHLEKRARLRGRHVSLLLAAPFTVERQVEHDLLVVGEQVVQPIDLGPGVRQAPAPAHHAMEVVVMLRVEGRSARATIASHESVRLATIR